MPAGMDLCILDLKVNRVHLVLHEETFDTILNHVTFNDNNSMLRLLRDQYTLKRKAVRPSSSYGSLRY